MSVSNLDYETHNNYKLDVSVTDGKHDATAKVHVIVADSNDPPHFDGSEFTTTLDEDSPENTVVKSLSVTSTSSGSHLCAWGFTGVTLEILSFFTLHTEPKSCTVKVKSGAKIKWRKGKEVYKFSLRAVNKDNKNEYSTASLEGMYVCMRVLSLIFWKVVCTRTI